MIRPLRQWVLGSLVGGWVLLGATGCGFLDGNRSAPGPKPGAQTQHPEPTQEPRADTVHRDQQAKRRVARQFLKRARRQIRRGNLQRAREALHRGLNLDPSHPGLWYELARVREHQGQYTKAETLAFRSLELSGANPELDRRNWRLIARVRKQLGDRDGAREARIQAGRAR